MALVNRATGERILPAFFADNYLSVLPGESKTIVVEFPEKEEAIKKEIRGYGWNVGEGS